MKWGLDFMGPINLAKIIYNVATLVLGSRPRQGLIRVREKREA